MRCAGFSVRTLAADWKAYGQGLPERAHNPASSTAWRVVIASNRAANNQLPLRLALSSITPVFNREEF